MPCRLTLSQRRRYLAAAMPDVVVMQGARHALNRPSFYPEWRIVYDMDDADFHLDHLRGPVIRAMGSVAAVMAGSRYIADWALEQGAPAAHVVWTGTPVSNRPCLAHGRRGPVVAWAQTRPMHYTREANLVADVMAKVAMRRPGVTLRLYDRRPADDPQFAARFRRTGLNVEWHPASSYSSFLAALDDVALGLAPLCPENSFSRGKSFGKVLAYLDRQVVVVGSEAGEHPAFFTQATGLLSNDTSAWVDGIVGLLDAPARRQTMAVAAAAGLNSRLSVRAAAACVSDCLLSVLERDGGSTALARA